PCSRALRLPRAPADAGADRLAPCLERRRRRALRAGARRSFRRDQGRMMDRKPDLETASYAIGRWCAAALLVTPDGRYLMQHRDDKPGILLPGHWALFGGTIDPG